VPVQMVLRDVQHRRHCGFKVGHPVELKTRQPSTQTSARPGRRLGRPVSVRCRQVGPMLPATATVFQRSTSLPVRDVTVVLPLVPVMPLAYNPRWPSQHAQTQLIAARDPDACAAVTTPDTDAGDRPGL
jgi:hypothetical protein